MSSDCSHLSISSRHTLSNGVQMPVIGIGTAKDSNSSGVAFDAKRVTLWAISTGVCLIDTASMYGTEREVGQAVKACGIPRDQLFVTSKVYPTEGYERTIEMCDETLRRLSLPFVDLYLSVYDRPRGQSAAAVRAESWRAMERLLEQGKCRAIGVSNYTIPHLTELLRTCRVPPAVNQIEVSPICYPKALIEFCQQHNILVNAYCPLARCELQNDATCVEIARAHGKTVAQVLLRWSLQHGLVPIPKTSTQARVVENAAVFDFSLTEAEMARLDALNRDEHTDWDPNGVP